MNTKLLIYSPEPSTRLDYVLSELFSRLLHAEFELTYDYAFFNSQKERPRLQYHTKPALFQSIPGICSTGLLDEVHIHPVTPSIGRWEQLPTLFTTETPQNGLPFDLFSAIFYLLSRYEEYLDVPRDTHNRFPARESLAKKNDFLHLPLVNLWALAFAKWLKSYYPNWHYKTTTYRFIPTYDIDMAWSYLHKGFYRQLGAGLKALAKGKWKMVIDRVRVQSNLAKDPYDVFKQLDQWHKQYHLSPIYFFLLGDIGPFDRNIPFQKKSYQNLIQQLAANNQYGLHPSYQSNKKVTQLKKEIQRLEYLTNETVSRSRQHFLKLRFPDTYNALLKNGIREDFTMGYADDIGFRASVATPFHWFNLKTNIPTPLLIYPFQLMDVSLRTYLRLSPNEAQAQIDQLIHITRAVGGTFISLWHNSSFAPLEGWKGWTEVYEYLLERAATKATS
ncbi:MAG: polysaccharide deacetylase family protein [Saprospiraceae bacterium]|nr:polysaccharide deacetylase family protein [Saprospiraceae bacterium]